MVNSYQACDIYIIFEYVTNRDYPTIEDSFKEFCICYFFSHENGRIPTFRTIKRRDRFVISSAFMCVVKLNLLLRKQPTADEFGNGFYKK